MVSIESQQTKLRMLPFLIGGLICIAFGLVDSLVLSWANYGNWNGVALWATFLVFILQAFVLSSYAGHGLQKSRPMLPAWIFFFIWSLLFTNLVFLILILNNSQWDRVMQMALSYAFFAAQIGFVVIWGILADYDWRKRLPFFGLALVVCSYPLWSLGVAQQQGWNSILTCYSIAVFVSAGVLRFSGFRISAIRFGPTEVGTDEENQKQFAIRNVLVWTLIVAVVVGIGRLIPWVILWDNLWANQIRIAVFGGLLMTVITVVSVWSALSDRTTIWLRIPFLILILAGVAFGLYQVEISTFPTGKGTVVGGRWLYSLVLGYQRITKADYISILAIWGVWCSLNGLFLYGLLQLFGFAGSKLVWRESAGR